VEKETSKTEIAQSITMLWAPLTDKQRELLVENISIRQLTRDEVLYSEGDTPTHLYYLQQGKITMHRIGVAGQRQIVRMVEPGAIFGYAAAIEGCDYRSTAVAGNDTEIVEIPINLMFHFIWENGNFAMLFLKELSSLLGLSVERTMNLTQKHIRGRLAEALLLMKEKYGVEEDGQTLAVYLSREDLAQISNMTTSNAIRTLSAFAKEGLIIIDGRKIKFVDTDELQVISDRG
jgi:CRP-like cAMP-binding protein